MISGGEIGFAREVADTVVFMDEGRIVEQGAPADALDRPENPRTRAYLGTARRAASSPCPPPMSSSPGTAPWGRGRTFYADVKARPAKRGRGPDELKIPPGVSPEKAAAELIEFVSTAAADGFILVPHLTPGGLDDFVDRVVPLLQERGASRSERTGSTLRSHLGLAEPVGKG